MKVTIHNDSDGAKRLRLFLDNQLDIISKDIDSNKKLYDDMEKQLNLFKWYHIFGYVFGLNSSYFKIFCNLESIGRQLNRTKGYLCVIKNLKYALSIPGAETDLNSKDLNHLKTLGYEI